MTLAEDEAGAYDAAFAGKTTHAVDAAGRTIPFAVHQWSSPPDWVDHALFIDRCDRPTIDVGCGPGRLAAELTGRNMVALGIDVSREAVRQARERGARALRLDVFGHVPGHGRWGYALLADGNLGIGGDPVRLLSRLRDIVSIDGQVIAEVAGAGVGLVREQRRLRVDGRLTAPFEWAVVGLDGIAAVAQQAGWHVVTTRAAGGRHTATLARSL